MNISDVEQRKELISCYNKVAPKKFKTISWKNIDIKVSKKMASLYGRTKKNNRTNAFLEIYDKSLSEDLSRAQAYSLIKQLERFDDFFTILNQAKLFLDYNPARSEFLLKQLMKKEMIEHILNADLIHISLKVQQRMLIKLLKPIYEHQDVSQSIKENFIYYIVNNTSKEFHQVLKELTRVKYSVSFLRKKYSSLQFGYKYPFVWGPKVYEESSQVEYDEYLKKVELSSYLKSSSPSGILFFRGIEGIRDEKKDSVLKALERVKSSSKFYDRFLYFRMLQDRSFYKFVNVHSKNTVKFLAADQRRYYKDLTKKNKISLITLLSLYSLGDIKQDYLIKYLAYSK